MTGAAPRVARPRRTGGWPRLAKATVLALVALPGALLAVELATGTLGPRPVTEAIHTAGLWALRLLFVALAITPAVRIAGFRWLAVFRRMTGVAAFAYATAHLGLFAADKMFVLSVVASEIVSRVYLAIGFVALVGLAVLAATSTDAAMRRLGRRWRSLHRAVYVIALLATVHFFLQSKADLVEPSVMAGLLFWLFGVRLIGAVGGRGAETSLLAAAALGLVAVLGIAAGEAVYFWLKMGVDPLRIAAANLSLMAGLRPSWVVAAAIAALLAVASLGRLGRRR